MVCLLLRLSWMWGVQWLWRMLRKLPERLFRVYILQRQLQCKLQRQLQRGMQELLLKRVLELIKDRRLTCSFPFANPVCST